MSKTSSAKALPFPLIVSTWNVNGIRAREAQFIEWVETDKPDIICLQEIKASLHQVPAALAELSDYWSFWHGGAGGYSGVSLHLRKEKFPEEPEFTHPGFDMETRMVQAEIENTVILSVYLPNGGKDFAAKMKFLAEMKEYVEAIHASGKHLLICGDMNIARTDADVYPSQRKPGVIGQRDDERAIFEEIIGQGLVDTMRELDPANDRLFTWWPFWKAAKERNLGWRLDYIFASKKLATHATQFAIRREFGTSDHAPVLVWFE